MSFAVLWKMLTHWYYKSRIRSAQFKDNFYNKSSCVSPNLTLYHAWQTPFQCKETVAIVWGLLWFNSNWKLYTIKELVMMEKSILDFHQRFYIPVIQTHYWISLLWQHTPGGNQAPCRLPRWIVTSILCTTCSSQFFTPNSICILY